VPLSSQSHRTYRAEVGSSLSVEPEASNLNVVASRPEAGATLTAAIGGLQLRPPKGAENSDVLPWLSVAVAVTFGPLTVPLQEKAGNIAFAVVDPY